NPIFYGNLWDILIEPKGEEMSRHLKIVIRLGLVLFLALGGVKGAQAQDAKKLQIAVIPKGSTHSFWKTIHAGAAKAAKELGVEIFWVAPEKEDDRKQQIEVVQNFISRGVDA